MGLRVGLQWFQFGLRVWDFKGLKGFGFGLGRLGGLGGLGGLVAL